MSEINAAQLLLIAGAEQTANKGVAGGYASLDGSGLVPTSQLPASSGGGVDWFDYYGADGLTRLGLTMATAATFREDFVSIAAWIGSTLTLVGSTYGGVVAAAGAAGNSVTFNKFASSDQFYMAVRTRFAETLDPGDYFQCGISNSVGADPTNYVALGARSAVSTTNFNCTVLGGGATNVVSTVAFNQNFNTHVFWYTGAAAFYSVNGETPISVATTNLVAGQFWSPWIRASSTNAWNDKVFVMTGLQP